MEESKTKGTVTSLASLFPVDEAQKAVKRVEDAIAEKKNELDRVQDFVSDNNNLINLVQKLPEQLSHDIMVPFGKAAFFPGRLIHTNEFLVLLGEGYYAERTSKQTIEILQRRGKSLDSQVDSLQAMVKDLEAEASFFTATASEAAEGLVEIREDYVEEESNEGESNSDPLKQDAPEFGESTTDNEEYARMMSRLDELEKEELAAESGNHGDLNEETTAGFDDISHQRPIDNNLQNSKDFHQGAPLDQTSNKIIATEFPKKDNHQQEIADQLNVARLALQSKVREEKDFAQNVESVDPSEKLPIIPKKKIAQATTTSKIEVCRCCDEVSIKFSV
ncbi:Prefoldin alpha-like [Sesbania bispinosa]|nr:Prefoldin alpha-like [Sesbania bispinosa]